MDKFRIRGGRPLYGRVDVSGAKNAAVAILPATILCDGPCRLENVPAISDTSIMLEILERCGASVRRLNRSTVEIDASSIRRCTPPYELVRKMRATYYLIGALLGRFGEACVGLPGGCDFGVRPIDLHIKGFEALGATVTVESGGIVSARAENGLSGASIYLDVASVGATINIMLAAALVPGITVIENAAREPHIVDLANFLNSMGADIKGSGTDTIKIRGVNSLHGGTYSIIPDQIEAGTYMVIAAAAGGEVTVGNVIPKHLESITAKLIEMGVEVEELDEAVIVRRGTGRLNHVNVKTVPYPGFPTDMQPQIVSLLTTAEGTSIVTDSVWDNRFRYVEELKRLGASIHVDGKTAVISGVEALKPAPVKACDLRAGAALVIAALAIDGVTDLEEIQYIERGYEEMEKKLRRLGADIVKVTVPEEPALEKAN